MTTYFHDINNAIARIHYNHGIGDIKEIRRFADGKIEVDALATSASKVHTRRGRIIQHGSKQTIYLYRHQLTVVII